MGPVSTITQVGFSFYGIVHHEPLSLNESAQLCSDHEDIRRQVDHELERTHTRGFALLHKGGIFVHTVLVSNFLGKLRAREVRRSDHKFAGQEVPLNTGNHVLPPFMTVNGGSLLRQRIDTCASQQGAKMRTKYMLPDRMMSYEGAWERGTAIIMCAGLSFTCRRQADAQEPIDSVHVGVLRVHVRQHHLRLIHHFIHNRAVGSHSPAREEPLFRCLRIAEVSKM